MAARQQSSTRKRVDRPGMPAVEELDRNVYRGKARPDQQKRRVALDRIQGARRPGIIDDE